ncbi:thioredoxin domain-containing protein [Skermanella rosea]|uniref:thioredoxin domain-containing protein n=1 Tax=Skermanella rosea TaxID=1817965 RepID=UPI0019335067|nr:thioredoxin domain-containing protein [Skermanella rosea]UEM03587.1 thioredoxin domain-containing protein [Skermanella rosea]
MSANMLGHETSPYLLQHKDNPVHWMPWGDEAFDRARKEKKPILLSVGYAACHWCHVMAHESFENPEIAGVMNDLFVNIKVDREERPDLDTIYQSALALLGQSGGWPLTMFLTPEGEPFWGGTYFPPASRYGRPGFPEVLRGVSATYHEEPDKVTRNVTALKDSLDKLAENHSGGAIPPGVFNQVADRLLREVDPLNGGIGSAPKFPQTSLFTLLWHAWKRTGREPYKIAVTNTLGHMCQGGIYDHLGGGFARYSTDDRWLAPHFEKMLYDNAQLIDLLTLVWQETGEPLFRIRVAETVDWVLREMLAEDAGGGRVAGFASTLDADSEGEEGRFYVWSEREIDDILGPDAAVFKSAYDVTRQGNWEGTNILNRTARPELGDDDHEASLARMRAILWQARERRVHPGWDDKVLADWNGLMIAALARSGFVFGRPDWIAAAAAAFDFVTGTMVRDGRLFHTWRRGQLKNPASLDDYANMARGALALYEVTGEPRYLDQTRGWVEVLDRHYWDKDNGGYFFTADDAERLIVRTKTAHDNAVPAGNGTMVGVLARLFNMTGDDAYHQRAEALVQAFSGELTRNFFPLSTLLNNTELLYTAIQLVVVGNRGAADTEALLATVRATSSPSVVMTLLSPETALPEGHPAQGKGMVAGKATAYVCANMTCSAPITDAADLKINLTRK